MAIRTIYSRFRRTLPHYARRKCYGQRTPIFNGRRLNYKQNSTTKKPAHVSTEPSINLDDSKELFSSFSTSKLIKSAVTLQMASNESMVDLGSWIMNSRLMTSPVTKRVLLESIQHTFYEHFCGGKDLIEAGRTIRLLWSSGLKAMLDYGLEHAHDNPSCDYGMNEIIKTISATKTFPNSSVSFVVVKITAICPVSLLKRVSDLLRWEYQDNSLHLPWKQDTFPVFAESTVLYHTLKRPEPLTETEETDLVLAYNRLMMICETSLVENVPLLIDAEDTSIQPAIDYFAYSAVIKYHKDDSPLVFNTIQAYLKDAYERLVMAKKVADKIGVPVGFKLVRGAYMMQETRLATSYGAKSPIHDTIDDTHACYNDCAGFMLEEIARGCGAVVLATHNLQSGKRAAAKAESLGINKDNENLHFAQLYGMAEALSYSLKNAGFNVSKYLPYGPVEHIMPYLLRRAEENRGLLSTASLDRLLMRKELLRRFTVDN